MPEINVPMATVISAVIAGVIALIGYFVTRKSAREALTQKQSEIELLLKEQHILLETARQEQLNEAFRKRAETYPKLYAIISDYGRSWSLRGKKRDLKWVDEFIEALLKNNSLNGVFFSQKVYKGYGNLRNCLTELRERFRNGEEVSEEEIEQLIYSIIMGEKEKPGLGSWLKDDLGSYVIPIVSNLHPEIKPSPFRSS